MFIYFVGSILIMIGIYILWKKGILRRWPARPKTQSVLQEDCLKTILICEMEGQEASLPTIARHLNLAESQAHRLIENLERAGFLVNRPEEIQLTPTGRTAALPTLRAHRLWEHYLATKTSLSPSEWHAQADQREHQFSALELAELEKALGKPTHDPHGDPIPTAAGIFQSHNGQPFKHDQRQWAFAYCAPGR